MATKAVIASRTLRLNEVQESGLMQRVIKRHGDTKTEMGFLQEKAYDGWMEERRQYRAEYANDFSHRKDPRNFAKYGPLYQSYNDSSVNLPKRAIRVYSARAREGMLNSQPLVGLMPEGEEDENKAMAVPGLKVPPDPIKLANRFWNRRLADAAADMHFRAGIEQCGVVGEVVYKITKKLAEDDDTKEPEQKIWQDGEGQPLRDTRGRFVFADEEFEPNSEALEGEVLKRDPSVVKPPDAALSDDDYPVEARMPKTMLDIQGLDYRSFICSPTAAGIHKDKTDYIAHEYDYTLDNLWKHTAGAKLTPEARAWREGLKSQSVQNKTEAGQPNEADGEKERGPSAPVVLHCAESWLTYDARGSGVCEEIYVQWDITTGHPIHYETAREMSVTGDRPFEVDRIIPVPDRWWGMSFYKLLANDHSFVDRQIVRLDSRTGTSGRFTYYRKGTLEDVEGGWDIELNSPRIHTATPLLKDGQHPVENVYLEAMDQQIWKLLEMRMQQAQLSTGTVTSGDAAAANLNPSETAAGQEMLQAESELMSSDTMQDARYGLEQTLKQSLVATFMDFRSKDEAIRQRTEEEAREMLGVENGNILIEWVKTHHPKSMLNYVKLLMTAAKNRKRAEANAQALQITTGGMPWIQLVQTAPQMAEQFKPLYKGVLETNEVEGIEGILKIPTAPTPASIMPGAPTLPNPNDPASFPAAA